MDQAKIDEINKTIPYMDGKIYWNDNEWTSRLWEEMKSSGWKEVKPEEDSEMVVVQDEKGRNIYAAEGRINMLRQLVNILI
ncbi:hypothetical protein ACOBQJ_04045 [Pelotomaculum propionicicum]|uniref:hypothetical protein n=1 Tax=Pelotomaculum propionicicum TaxID=258475 RepID=UPI003B7C3D1B